MDPSAAEPPLEDAAPLTVGSFVEVRDKTDEPWAWARPRSRARALAIPQHRGPAGQRLRLGRDAPASDAAVRALDPASGLALAPSSRTRTTSSTPWTMTWTPAAADAAAGPALPPKLLRLTVSHNLIRNFGQEAGVDPFGLRSPPAAGLPGARAARQRSLRVARRATAYDKTDLLSVVWLYRDDNTPKAQWRVPSGRRRPTRRPAPPPGRDRAGPLLRAGASS